MFNVYYDKYKYLFWLILTLLCFSGAVTNFFNGSTFEVIVNSVLWFICFSVLIVLYVKENSKEFLIWNRLSESININI